MSQVFGCPKCQNPFQVPDNAAGQTFQCPTCKTTVEVPSLDPSSDSPEPEPETEIFACPHCTGQFGINASMHGAKLACPHCAKSVFVDSAPEESIAAPIVNTKKGATRPPVVQTTDDDRVDSIKTDSVKKEDPSEHRTEKPIEAAEEKQPLPEAVFQQQSVDHLLPPRFDVPDPVRFPRRLGSSEVILPDGEGGYQSVDANIVKITHNGEVYHLKRLTPKQRQRRQLIHSTIAIFVAVLLIFLTLRTLGLLL